jgi:hypothetical protein
VFGNAQWLTQYRHSKDLILDQLSESNPGVMADHQHNDRMPFIKLHTQRRLDGTNDGDEQRERRVFIPMFQQNGCLWLPVLGRHLAPWIHDTMPKLLID